MVPQVATGGGMDTEVRRRPQVCTVWRLGVRRAIGAGMLQLIPSWLQGAAAGASWLCCWSEVEKDSEWLLVRVHCWGGTVSNVRWWQLSDVGETPLR